MKINFLTKQNQIDLCYKKTQGISKTEHLHVLYLNLKKSKLIIGFGEILCKSGSFR